MKIIVPIVDYGFLFWIFICIFAFIFSLLFIFFLIGSEDSNDD